MIMRTLIYIKFFIFLIACGTNNHMNENDKLVCDENLKFKIQFFKNIKVVEDYVKIEDATIFNNLEEYEQLMTKEKQKQFLSSLQFISKYAPVSFESMANYAHKYPIGIFQEDKKGWLNWYEENKCKNIQFK